MYGNGVCYQAVGATSATLRGGTFGAVLCQGSGAMRCLHDAAISGFMAAGQATFNAVAANALTAGTLTSTNAATCNGELHAYGGLQLKQNGCLVLEGAAYDVTFNNITASGVSAAALQCKGAMETTDITVLNTSSIGTLSVQSIKVNRRFAPANLKIAASQPMGAFGTDTLTVSGVAGTQSLYVGTRAAPQPVLICKASACALNGGAAFAGDIHAGSLSATDVTCASLSDAALITSPQTYIYPVNRVGQAGPWPDLVLSMQTVSTDALTAAGKIGGIGAVVAGLTTANSATVSHGIIAASLNVATISADIVATRSPMTLTCDDTGMDMATYFLVGPVGTSVQNHDVSIVYTGGGGTSVSVLQWMQNFDLEWMQNFDGTVAVPTKIRNLTRATVDIILAIFKGALACAFGNTMGLVRTMDMMVHVVDIFSLGTAYHTSSLSGGLTQVTVTSSINSTRVQDGIGAGAAYVVDDGKLYRIVYGTGASFVLQGVGVVNTIGAGITHQDLILCSVQPEFCFVWTMMCTGIMDVTALYGALDLYVYKFTMTGVSYFDTTADNYCICTLDAAAFYKGYVAYSSSAGGKTLLYIGSFAALDVSAYVPGRISVYKLEPYTVPLALGTPPLDFAGPRACYDMDSINTLIAYYLSCVSDMNTCLTASACATTIYHVVAKNGVLNLVVLAHNTDGTTPTGVTYIQIGTLLVHDEPIDGYCTVMYSATSSAMQIVAGSETVAATGYSKYYAYTNQAQFAVPADDVSVPVTPIYLRKFARVTRAAFSWPWAFLAYYDMPFDEYTASVGDMVMYGTVANTYQLYDRPNGLMGKNIAYYILPQVNFLAEQSVTNATYTVTYTYPTYDINNTRDVSILSLIQTGFAANIATIAFWNTCNTIAPTTNLSQKITITDSIPADALFYCEGTDWVSAVNVVPGFMDAPTTTTTTSTTTTTTTSTTTTTTTTLAPVATWTATLYSDGGYTGTSFDLTMSMCTPETSNGIWIGTAGLFYSTTPFGTSSVEFTSQNGTFAMSFLPNGLGSQPSVTIVSNTTSGQDLGNPDVDSYYICQIG